MDAYSPTVERMMKRLFRFLRENDCRRYRIIAKWLSLWAG